MLLELDGIIFDGRAARERALTAAAGALHVPFGRAVAAAAAAAGETGFDAALLPLVTSGGGGAALDATTASLLAHRAGAELGAELESGITLCPGAGECLAQLAAHTRIGVVTQLGRRAAAAVLRLAELEAVATLLVTGDDAAPPPPSPRTYAIALEKLARRTPGRPPRAVALVTGARSAAAATAASVPWLLVSACPLAADAGGEASETRLASATTLDALTWDRLAELAGEPLETAR